MKILGTIIFLTTLLLGVLFSVGGVFNILAGELLRGVTLLIPGVILCGIAVSVIEELERS